MTAGCERLNREDTTHASQGPLRKMSKKNANPPAAGVPLKVATDDGQVPYRLTRRGVRLVRAINRFAARGRCRRTGRRLLKLSLTALPVTVVPSPCCHVFTQQARIRQRVGHGSSPRLMLCERSMVRPAG